MASLNDQDVREPGLDAALLGQTVPQGSMRYYALLYAPADKRDFLVALHLLEDELDATARGSNHDVAHARLRWWNEEFDRLLRGRPVHPATQELQRGRQALGEDLGKLRSLLDAAAMDLAQVTYADDAELIGYFDRRGATPAELVARWLLAPSVPSAPTLAAARKMGAAISRTEALASLRANVVAGRVHLPLAGLDQSGIPLSALREETFSRPVQTFLQTLQRDLRAELAGACAGIGAAERAAMRPLIVFAALHLRLLERVGAGLASNATARARLGAFEKLWWAWRAARQAR